MKALPLPHPEVYPRFENLLAGIQIFSEILNLKKILGILRNFVILENVKTKTTLEKICWFTLIFSG